MKKIISMIVIAIFALTSNIKAQTQTEVSSKQNDMATHCCKKDTMPKKCNMQGMEKCKSSDKTQKCNMADCKEVCKDSQSKCTHSDSKKCEGADCKKGKMKNMPMKDCPMMKG